MTWIWAFFVQRRAWLFLPTPVRFSSYLKLCISEFRTLKLRIKACFLALIWYKKIRIPKPDDQDMIIVRA